MKTILTAVALLLFTVNPSYFKYQRTVQASPATQQYFVVDDAVWEHARPDLGDIRLVPDAKEVPYTILIESGNAEHERKDVPVLQQSTINSKTQFLVDMSQIAEYSRLELKLATKDYVAHAIVEGSDDPHAKQWATLGDGILYDLSSDRLGNNSILRLPVSRYKYLRVTVDGPVSPKDVRGASVELGGGQPPLYRTVHTTTRQEQRGKDTVFTFTLSGNVPVNRIRFSSDPAQPNFYRSVEVQDSKSGWLGSGEISRIHMVRNGRRLDSESSEIPLSSRGQKEIRVIIHNGDDPPLKIASATLEQYERRVYFNVPAQGQLTLYYGDEKLSEPIYDYARLFQLDQNAVAANLAPEVVNAGYKGRPDDRPWSERHPAVLWSAIIAAVLILGALALRSLRA
ncbi:MAG: DUF3999 family protein [Acidobacteriaceae bacterium]